MYKRNDTRQNQYSLVHKGNLIMKTAQADKRALTRMLAGLVFCTLLTGFAAITVTGNSLKTTSDGYAYPVASAR